jgi:hypothetical protein
MRSDLIFTATIVERPVKERVFNVTINAVIGAIM